MEKVVNLSILGGGAWGTALGIALAPRFDRVRQWIYEHDLALRMAATRQNDIFLPGCTIPNNLEPVSDLTVAIEGASIVIGVMPSHHARRLYREALPHVHVSTTFVSATKGMEAGTLLRMSQVMEDVIGTRFDPKIAIISGPSFAREVAKGEPTALAVASTDAGVAAAVQEAFSGPTFRLYTSTDPIGVELGGALKNVIAIAAGVVQGLGLGNNTMAALITRGLAEITRLGVAMGAQPRTMSGLAGMGDLVLTCTGDLSRNRKVGIELARGRTLIDILGSTPTVAEGVETNSSAVALGAKFGVDLPIIQQMHAVLHGTKSPRDAIRDLMERSLKSE
ncbi:MAG: NAD(P)H-dependent glycerol-3-phosphate dehydrogenase [Bryobacteraceae bacterium]